MKTKILQKAFLTLTASRNRGCVRFFNLLFAGTILILALTLVSPANAQGQMIGINVLLNQPPSNSILQDLGTHGEVLDVISQINGVTLRAHTSELSTIQTLPYVAGANPDAQDYPQSDFSAGGELISQRRGSRWSLLEVLAAGAE